MRPTTSTPEVGIEHADDTLFISKPERMVVLHKGEEDRHHSVVVKLLDRIELMIVAPRAIDGKSHERTAGCSDNVVEVGVAVLRIVFLAEADARTDAIETGSDQAVVRGRIEFVAGKLFANETDCTPAI